MIFVLIRHGRTQANEDHLYCGATDLPLSENGRKELIARTAEIDYPPIEGLCVCTSGMKRTNETLEVIYHTSPQKILPGLAEMNFGRFEMFSYEQMKEDPAYLAWILDETGTIAPDGGESREAFRNRVRASIDAVQVDSLIVTHGGVITEIMSYLFAEENKGFYDWQPDCGCGYIVNTDLHTYEKISPR